MNNLAILGIDDDLLEVMKLERIGKAPWCRGFSGHSNYAPTQRPQRKPPKSVTLKSKFSGETREISLKQPEKGSRRVYPLAEMQVGDFFLAKNVMGRTTEQTSNTLQSCIANCKRKTGFKFTTHRTSRGVKVTRIA